VGRDPAEIERSASIWGVCIRDDRAEAEKVFQEAFGPDRAARARSGRPVGTPEDIAAHLAPYVELGYRHLIAGFRAPYDEESMTRLVTDVKPLLERV
jgi:alkanesulfonate monooxygenase SsuD/methylene tetrahydromethanopterin reductase-like flavin-dependent oxidoreductase (luciferase family)